MAEKESQLQSAAAGSTFLRRGASKRKFFGSRGYPSQTLAWGGSSSETAPGIITEVSKAVASGDLVGLQGLISDHNRSLRYDAIEEGRTVSHKKAFLFDMDGTLIDSEPLHLAAWRLAVERCGGDSTLLTEAFFESFIGDPSDGLARALCSEKFERCGMDVSTTPSSLSAVKLEAFLELGASGNHSVSVDSNVVEAVSIVKCLGHSIQMCTGSRLAVATACLRSVPMLDRLFSPAKTKRTTQDDTEDSKPAAAPYLRAASLAGCSPVDCFAFEDSPTGLASATAAKIGTRYGILTSNFTPEQLLSAGAHHIFPSLREAVDHALSFEVDWKMGEGPCESGHPILTACRHGAAENDSDEEKERCEKVCACLQWMLGEPIFLGHTKEAQRKVLRAKDKHQRTPLFYAQQK